MHKHIFNGTPLEAIPVETPSLTKGKELNEFASITITILDTPINGLGPLLHDVRMGSSIKFVSQESIAFHEIFFVNI